VVCGYSKKWLNKRNDLKFQERRDHHG
jgi:hypothetical protein